MKAVILKDSGGTENFTLQEIPIPQTKPNEVLVKVYAIGINPVDAKTRKGGSLYGTLKAQEPIILGWDISGIVHSVGNEVKGFKAGDAVFGMVNFPGRGKAYAEYVAAPEDHLAMKPEMISHGEAAAASLAALTAWQVLVQEANIQPGQHLLIHAAAGGVGHYAVQIARHLGARITGTASASNASFLKEIGVNHHIDYTQQDFEKEVRDIEIVFDPIGGETTKKSLEIIKPGGILISIVGGVKDNLHSIIEEKNVLAKNYLVHSSGADMAQIAILLMDGIVKSHISHQFSFEQFAEAHQQIETGKTRGKVIVHVENQ